MIEKIKYLTILFLLLIVSSCTCLKWHTKKPEGLIDKVKAKELHDNYKNNQYRFINQSVKNDSVIIGEETILPEAKKPYQRKEKGDGGLGYLEIEMEQLKTVSNAVEGYKDNYEAWFSIDRLGSFLVSTEKEARAMDKENIGIRVYFGSYIINDELKTTVIFVPTYFNGSTGDDINDPNLQENIYGLPCLNFGNAGIPPVPYTPN